MKEDRKFYLDELRSEQCWCERKKRPWYSFCYLCFKKLPKWLQRDLYNRIGEGYEEAYDKAIKHLGD